MLLALCITPSGHLAVEESAEPGNTPLADAVAGRIQVAFAGGCGQGLFQLATGELQTPLPADFSFAREFARTYLTKLCHTPGLETAAELPPLPAPPREELAFVALQAPPLKGLEYLNADALGQWWDQLDQYVRADARDYAGGVQAYLVQKNPLWRLVGRVTFHLAENKRDPDNPFAFMATYANRLSAQARVQHLPLARALEEYAGAKNHPALLSLLTPIHRAAEKSELAKAMVDSGDLYHALAWTPRDAYRFLSDIPIFEESGIIVRVPDWWKAKRPPRPQVSVRIGEKKRTTLGADALLDFSVRATLEGQALTEEELRSILASASGLVLLKGKWVEVDREKLAEAMEHWKSVEQQARNGEISFLEGMRLLAGVNLKDEARATAEERSWAWSDVAAGEWLAKTLGELRGPESLAESAIPAGLNAQLRPYQQTGLNWLNFMRRLGLGACLADDMGLGKTIQVLAMLLHMRHEGTAAQPSLLVVPASLIANWKAEMERFTPTLHALIAHPSETPAAELTVDEDAVEKLLAGHDLVITTYGMLTRLQWMKARSWNLAILDEAQAIKNAGTRQTRAVKELKAKGRIVLTGTPVENRLADLWSLFDFINPGLLGNASAFGKFVKNQASQGPTAYAPLRSLVRPYILRRLKTDKSIIADLPEKTEVRAFCSLSRQQAALYQQAVGELDDALKMAVAGIQRKGLVLAYLMRLKQICNHPSQWLGDGGYDPKHSGKFDRLREICEELAQRQQKALIFTQFREITEPLSMYLAGVFGRPGLVLTGQTAVGKRRALVEDFQREDGPPFFVLSLKAGGTGLNLTAASHVIHFDRWWNPAVENQATDRAFRIGQKKNVLVHKFVCQGTVEDKIDAMIGEKTGLSRQLLEGDGQTLLTEMSDKELLRLVALDINRALE